jgi:hypothetical protein
LQSTFENFIATDDNGCLTASNSAKQYCAIARHRPY